MTEETDPKTSSSSSTIIIVVLVIVVISLAAVIVFLLRGNNNNSPQGGESTPPQIELPVQLPSGPTVIALEAINVRNGPGTNYPSYGIAPQGSVGEVIGVSADGGWWVIKLPTNIAPDGQGWVAAEYVQADNIGTPPIIEPPPLP